MRRVLWVAVMAVVMPIAIVVGAALAIAALVVLVVDLLAWGLCAVGFHRPGHWVRTNMVAPVWSAIEALDAWQKTWGKP